jgi:anthranilate phosphoribosyltransferase
MIAHGLDGLDEISTIGKTSIAWLKDGKVTKLVIAPKDLGIKLATLKEISGTNPEESAKITFKILYGCCDNNYSRKNMVLANSAAGIIVGGKAENFSYGMEVARESIESGAAYKKLKLLVSASKGDMSKLEEFEREHG